VAQEPLRSGQAHPAGQLVPDTRILFARWFR
jgi:hypothetical protein